MAANDECVVEEACTACTTLNVESSACASTGYVEVYLCTKGNDTVSESGDAGTRYVACPVPSIVLRNRYIIFQVRNATMLSFCANYYVQVSQVVLFLVTFLLVTMKKRVHRRAFAERIAHRIGII